MSKNCLPLLMVAAFVLVGGGLLTSCSSVPLPKLGTVKHAGKKYEYRQTKLLGVPVSKPTLHPIKTKGDDNRDDIRIPAKWLLWLSLPGSVLVAIVGAVAVVYLKQPKLARLVAVASIGLFIGALVASAWLIASTYLWLFVPILVLIIGGGVYYIHRLTFQKKGF